MPADARRNFIYMTGLSNIILGRNIYAMKVMHKIRPKNEPCEVPLRQEQVCTISFLT